MTLRGAVNERSCGSKGLTRINHNKRASSRNVHRPTGLKSPKSRYLANKGLLKLHDVNSDSANWRFLGRTQRMPPPPAPQKEVTCNRFSGRFSQNEPHLHGHVHRHFLSRAASRVGSPGASSLWHDPQHSNHWAKGWVRIEESSLKAFCWERTFWNS